MEDYTIARDAHGNHYLSHGIEWKNHKYIKKLGQGASALYFYTPDELKRYLQNVAKTAQKTGESVKAAGQEVAKKMQVASETAKAVKQKVQEVSQKAPVRTKTAETEKLIAKKPVPKVNSKRQVTPHAPLNLSMDHASNQAQLDKAKKEDAQSKKDDDLNLLADWSEGRKPSGDHGLTSHGRRTDGTAKAGWNKKRNLPSSIQESSDLLGGKTAMGKDYTQEMFKSALQQYAEILDDVRVKGSDFQSLKEMEFEMARTKELNEDLKQQLNTAKNNLVQNTLQSGPTRSIKEIQRLKTELKNNERSLKALESEYRDLQEYYDQTMSEFETLLEQYKNIYM